LTSCGSVGCSAATDVTAVTGRQACGATKVRAATDSSTTARSSNENTIAAWAAADAGKMACIVPIPDLMVAVLFAAVRQRLFPKNFPKKR
jgi:hypothetical protein